MEGLGRENGTADILARPQTHPAKPHRGRRHHRRLHHPLALRVVQHRRQLEPLCEHVGHERGRGEQRPGCRPRRRPRLCQRRRHGPRSSRRQRPAQMGRYQPR